MKHTEFKLTLPGKTRRQSLTLSGQDVKVLLLRSGETVTSLSAKIGVSRTHLARCINGSAVAPEIRRKLVPELERILASLQQSRAVSASALLQ